LKIEISIETKVESWKLKVENSIEAKIESWKLKIQLKLKLKIEISIEAKVENWKLKIENWKLKIEISIEENNFNWKLKFQLNSIFKLDMYGSVSTTFGQTEFQSLLITITDFWNQCFFDLGRRFRLPRIGPRVCHRWFPISMFFWPLNTIFTVIEDLWCQSPRVSHRRFKFVSAETDVFFTPRMTHIRTPWPRKPKVRLSFNGHWSL